MNENIQKFLKQFLTDETFRAKFSAVKTPEEAYELAKSVQDGFTREEFLEAVQQLAALDEADITDDDLATAAGGAGPIVESNALTKKTESGIQIIRSKGVPDVTIFSGEPAGELKLTNMGNETVLKSIKNALP